MAALADARWGKRQKRTKKTVFTSFIPHQRCGVLPKNLPIVNNRE
jgi:hypothetical protein